MCVRCLSNFNNIVYLSSSQSVLFIQTQLISQIMQCCHVLPRARCLNTCLRHQISRRILNQGKKGSFQLGSLSTDILYQSFLLYRVDLFFSPQLRIVEQNHIIMPFFGLYQLYNRILSSTIFHFYKGIKRILTLYIIRPLETALRHIDRPQYIRPLETAPRLLIDQ